MDLIERLEELEEVIPRRRIPDFSNPLERWDGEEFRRRFRLKKETFIFICQFLSQNLVRQTRRSFALPVCIVVAIATQYFASDSFQIVISDIYNVSQYTVSRCVSDFIEALLPFLRVFVKWPEDADMNTIRRKFTDIAGKLIVLIY